MKTDLRGALALVPLALLLACGRSDSAPAEPPADAVYTVRAEIVQLPPAPGGELYLHHESIPTLRDSKGEVVGMASMTMPFAAPAELDLSGWQPGDRAEVTFEIRWSAPRMPLRVTRLVPLPDGTPLEFDPMGDSVAADPPTGAPASEVVDAEAQPEGDTPR